MRWCTGVFHYQYTYFHIIYYRIYFFFLVDITESQNLEMHNTNVKVIRVAIRLEIIKVHLLPEIIVRLSKNYRTYL